MRALADFHAAAASFPSQESSVACSPSLTERARRLRHYVRGGLPEIASALAAGGWPELQGRGRRLLALFSAAAPGFVELVDRAAQTPTRLQPCIRDIRPEHVLFTGDVVTGIVDFGAMRSESVAADVARLLGGMAGDDLPAWRVGLESYEAIRPLDNTERFLLGVFNQTAVLLSGMNWLQWICVEQRRFDNPRQILARLDAILDRMARLSQPAPFR
jgi:homoserine kinase type II